MFLLVRYPVVVLKCTATQVASFWQIFLVTFGLHFFHLFVKCLRNWGLIARKESHGDLTVVKQKTD